MEIEDELDYVICPKCNGEGLREYTITQNKTSYTEENYCNKCNGFGKVDWIQYIIPEKQYWHDDDTIEDYCKYKDKYYSFEEYETLYEEWELYNDPYYVEKDWEYFDKFPIWYDWDDYEDMKLKNRDMKKRKKKKCLKKRPSI